MDEEKAKGKETAVTDSDAGDTPEEPTLIEQTNAAAERLEAANAKQEELLIKQEKAEARRRLSGRSEAGSQPVKKAPETNEEYTERFERGEVNPLEDDGAI